MRRARLSIIAGCLALSTCFGSDAAIAQPTSPPPKPVQTQPKPSNPPLPDSQTMESGSSLIPSPISPACPFPVISLSKAASKVFSLFDLLVEVEGKPRKTSLESTSESSDSSDSDFYFTVHDLVGAKKLDEALQVAQRIKGISTRNDALQRVAEAYKQAGNLDKALQIAKSMKDLPPDSPDSSSSKDSLLSEIAKAYAEVGNPDKALQIADGLGEATKSFTLLDIAGKYRSIGQLDRATELISQSLTIYRKVIKPLQLNPQSATPFDLITLARFSSEYALLRDEMIKRLNLHPRCLRLLEDCLSKPITLLVFCLLLLHYTRRQSSQIKRLTFYPIRSRRLKP